MQFKKIHLKFLVNACKNVSNLFLFLPSFFFLLIINDRVGRKCLCRQNLENRVLQITQNNISHTKSLMINYIII